MDECLAAIRPDRRCLLADRGVPEEVIGRIGHMGITRINVFAETESVDSKVHEWLEADIGLRGSEGAPKRVHAAMVLDAWEATRDRVVKQNDMESERRALCLQNEMLKGSLPEFRRVLGQVPGRLKDFECPTLDIVTTVKMQEQQHNLLQF